MKRSLMSLLAVVMLVAAVPLASAAEKAMCVVCQVKHGESEPEDVKADRTHEGVRYAFCSKGCAEEFDADPLAFATPKFPRPAPSFAVKDLEGKPIELGGNVTLVDFWATWCAPCRKTMPELQALHAKYAGRGFRVVGVSIDEDGADKVKKFLKEKKITYPIAIDGGDHPAYAAFRVKAVPAAYLIDREGRVVAQWLGAGAPVRELEKALAPLLAEGDAK